MGKPPAYIFVVRHGNRLDVADKSWAVTSPTPYDSPLTYGGWLQARTLGAKIASIITDAEAEYEASTGQDAGSTTGAEKTTGLWNKGKKKKKTRRFKVAIHSSPFLRCIQTSVGISAGLCEPPGSPPPYPRQTRSNSVASSQISRPLARRSTLTPAQSTTGSEPLMNPLDLKKLKFAHRLFPKQVLRLDPFLGEWLSPDYFETIQPPPSTTAMLDTAKAELLRREDYSKYPDPGLQAKPIIRNIDSQLWKAGDGESPLDDTSSLSSALLDASSHAQQGGYTAPMPNYAISNNVEIPEGYVAHARDACLTVDYQWDSASPPQNWGDGGMYGEEWTAMHKRFRNGVQHLIEWYASCDSPTDMNWKMAPVGTNGATNGHAHKEEEVGGEEHEEAESVVILVSHGAGCNALIGAITHQPALMDVGLASITLAVRKPMEGYKAIDGGPKTLLPVHQCYDLKMTANADHLRGVTTPSSPTVGPTRAQGGPTGLRGRGSTISSLGYQAVLGPFTYTDTAFGSEGGGGGSRSTSASASMGLGHLKRGSKGPSNLSMGGTAAGGLSSGGPVRQSSFGLWSPARPDEDEDDDFFPDFDNKRFDTTSTTETSEQVTSESTTALEVPGGFTLGTSLATSAASSTLALPDFDRPMGEASEATEATEASKEPKEPKESKESKESKDSKVDNGGSGGGLWTSGRAEKKPGSEQE